MPDYNVILTDADKLEIIQKLLEVEKDKLHDLLSPDANPEKHLEVWEAYYSAVKELNEMFGSTNNNT